MSNYLKKNFCFNSKIFTIDFNKASGKAIKLVFPEVILNASFIMYITYGNIL